MTVDEIRAETARISADWSDASRATIARLTEERIGSVGMPPLRRIGWWLGAYAALARVIWVEARS